MCCAGPSLRLSLGGPTQHCDPATRTTVVIRALHKRRRGGARVRPEAALRRGLGARAGLRRGGPSQAPRPQAQDSVPSTRAQATGVAPCNSGLAGFDSQGAKVHCPRTVGLGALGKDSWRFPPVIHIENTLPTPARFSRDLHRQSALIKRRLVVGRRSQSTLRPVFIT